jgi:D-alanine-D-alanine ligase
MKKIAIFCGGPSVEHEVSINSAKTILKFIDKSKYEVVVCFISKGTKAKIIRSKNIDFEKINPSQSLPEILQILKKEKYFALLSGIHGEFGEDGKLQNLLEMFDIPYSGSDSKGSSLSMDKYKSLTVVSQIQDLEIPTSRLTNTRIPNQFKNIVFPLIIKPNSLGSSVGIFVAKNEKEIRKAIKALKEKLELKNVLIQEYLEEAIEISCGCLMSKNGKFISLPPIEIKPKKSKLFDYASKYEIGGSEEITPPVSISKKLSNKISDLTYQIHTLLGLKTYSRSDFMIKNDKIYYLETNTLPGMTATSLLPQEAMEAGIPFPKLLDFIIENS